MNEFTNLKDVLSYILDPESIERRKNQPTSFRVPVPEGYEIDQEKSTFENIVFKKIEKKGWEGLGSIEGFHVTQSSDVEYTRCLTLKGNENVFPMESQARGVIALAQLLQLKKSVDPEWNGKYVIRFNRTVNDFRINTSKDYSGVISFSSKELAEKFLEDNRKLLMDIIDFL